MSIFILLFIAIVNGEPFNNQKLSVARQNLASATLSNYGIAIFAGGYDSISCSSSINNIYDTVDIYSLNTNRWTTSKLSQSRFDLSGVSLSQQGFIIFAGGKTSLNSYSNRVDIYNVNSNSWSLTSLSVARGGMMATSLHKKNLAIFAGGVNTQADNLKIIDIYNGLTNSWTTGELAVGRSYGGAVGIDNVGQAFFVGGFIYPGVDTYDSNKILSNAFEIYDSNTNTWILKTAPASIGFPLVSYFTNPNSVNVFSGSQVDTYGHYVYDVSNQTFTELSTRYNWILNGATGFFPSKHTMFNIGGQYYEMYNPQYADVILDHFSGRYRFLTMESFYDLNTLDNLFNLTIANFDELNIFIASGGINVINSGCQKQNIDINVFVSYCDGGIATGINPRTCSPIPEGKFSPYINKTIDCLSGTYCPPGKNFPELCPAGTYNERGGMTSVSNCTKCPIGTWQPSQGTSLRQACMPCNMGTFCPEGTSIFEYCPSNNYCPTANEKIPCPAGTYFDSNSALSVNDCKVCNPGYYCESGKPQLSCTPGYYSPKNGSSSCLSCPQGHACPYSTINPKICPINTKSGKGSSACTPCDQGEYTEKEGSLVCKTCLGGTFDINGWWCMTIFERVVFASILAGTIFSALASIWKFYKTVKEKIKVLRENNLKLNLYNFIFTEKVVEEKQLPTKN